MDTIISLSGHLRSWVEVPWESYLSSLSKALERGLSGLWLEQKKKIVCGLDRVGGTSQVRVLLGKQVKETKAQKGKDMSKTNQRQNLRPA